MAGQWGKNGGKRVVRGRLAEKVGKRAPLAYAAVVSSPKYLLVLEDSLPRLRAIQDIAKRRALQVIHWSDVHTMRKEAPTYFRDTALLSLDYDLSGSRYCEIGDPGTGQDIVEFLLTLTPFCPVILHTSLEGKGKLLAILLRNAGWRSDWAGIREQADLSRWEKLVESCLAQTKAD
jgi:hypothetical protein